MKETIIHPIPLSFEDLEVGSVLGSGAFASVYRVNLRSEPPLQQDDNDQLSTTDVEDAEDTSDFDDLLTAVTFPDDASSLVTTGTSSRKSSGRLVVKRIKQDCQSSDDDTTRLAALGLAREIAILSSLPAHPNVIRLVGVPKDTIVVGKDPLQSFLVLERVEDSLDNLLKEWRAEAEQSKSKTMSIFWRKRRMENMHAQRNRVQQIGVGLASAMKFIHAHGIIHRDIKPGNIGVSYDGQPKLLDFGSACKCKEPNRKLTRAIGTARYMAPEVAASHVYGPSADVHSFAIVLWEVLTLRRPFAGLAKTKKELKILIQVHKSRPLLNVVASPALRRLLRASWDPKPERRPESSYILAQLETEAAKSKERKVQIKSFLAENQ